jgi:hypothetical protein
VNDHTARDRDDEKNDSENQKHGLGLPVPRLYNLRRRRKLLQGRSRTPG